MTEDELAQQPQKKRPPTISIEDCGSVEIVGCDLGEHARIEVERTQAVRVEGNRFGRR